MYYFAYGLNLHPRRNKDWKFIALYKLKDFRWFINERGVATIAPDDDNFVWGAIFKITSQDLEHLDRFEGYPKWYDRNTFPFDVSGKSEVAIYYCDIVSDRDGASPRPGYIESILEGLNQLNFPQEWIRHIDGYS